MDKIGSLLSRHHRQDKNKVEELRSKLEGNYSNTTIVEYSLAEEGPRVENVLLLYCMILVELYTVESLKYGQRGTTVKCPQ